MQRSLKLAVALALAATAAALAGCATADEPAVPDPSEQPEHPPQEEGMRWISIGSDALGTAQMALDERHRGRILTPVKVSGDVAILAFDAADFGALSELMHERHKRCGGFMVHESLEAAEASIRRKATEGVAPLVTYTIDNPTTVNGMLTRLQEPRIRSFITSLSGFQNRYYTSSFGVQSSDFIFNQWSQIAAGRSDIAVQRFTHTWAQSSIILTITGTSLPNEVVIIGGHQDSIASGNATSIAPGADDDASGIATITEVLRAVVESNYRPARTVKLMAYAAEEVGLRGSAAIAADYRSRGVNVVGVVQFDMTLFKGTANRDIVLMTDNTNAAQNTFVTNLINTYTGAVAGTDSCGYACSDHASWDPEFPASMPFESNMNDHNSRIHTSGDTLANSGGTANHALKFAKLGVAYLGELAKGTLNGAPPVNTAPTVSISAPSNGSTVGTTVTLTGSASDTQDGNLSSSISWSSNVAGNLGTGASLSVTLAAGAHTLTAAVTDSGGLTASTSVSITVSASGGTAFSDNFEGTLGWTVSGLWHKVSNSTCASPGYSSAVSSLYYGQDSTCNFSTGARTTGTATSPSFSGLTSASRLSFKYYRRVESASGNYDIASVAVVVGSTATTVWTRNATNASTTTWQDSGLISLAQFAGQTVQLRLTFDSVDNVSNAFTGWLIDDVLVTK